MKKKKQLVTKITRSIAFVSDLHVGSRYAVCPEKFKTAEGQWLIPSAGQASLNDSFAAFGEKCNELKVDTVLVLGDLLDGQNVAENGTGISSSNMDEQISMGVGVLGPLVQKSKDHPSRLLLTISGSAYHKSVRGLNPEKQVCDVLGGTWLGPIANLQFKPSHRIVNCHHGYSGSVIYREMVLAREGLFAKWAAGTGKLPTLDMLIRAHLHNFIYIHEHGMHLLQLPCWQAFNPSKVTLGLYSKNQPDIGGCVVIFDQVDRIVVHHYLYPVPMIAGEVSSV